jgi:thermostable 8-oxoguanine DNA glycosylase
LTCGTASSRGRYVQTSCFMLKKIFDTQAWTREDLLKAEIDYSFQEQLTKELDAKTDNFDDVTFLKIVLWKTNRYPTLESETVAIINDLRRNYSLEKAKNALFHLLRLKGFDLPMASTVLRFACPTELQIIDKRVYRLIMPENELKIPRETERKVVMYFEYLEKLKQVSIQHNIPFEKSDRILYQLDKRLNAECPINY